MSFNEVKNASSLRDSLREKIKNANQIAEKVVSPKDTRYDDPVYQISDKAIAINEEKAFGSQEAKETSELLRDAQIRHQDAKTDRIQTVSKSLRADSDLKCKLAGRTFRVVEGWVVCVAAVTILHLWVKKGDADPNVLLGVIGVTPVILGLAGYILKGLFSSVNTADS